MKKLLVVLCMLTCIFATTACGNEKEVVEPDFVKIMDDAEVERYIREAEEFAEKDKQKHINFFKINTTTFYK